MFWLNVDYEYMTSAEVSHIENKQIKDSAGTKIIDSAFCSPAHSAAWQNLQNKRGKNSLMILFGFSQIAQM